MPRRWDPPCGMCGARAYVHDVRDEQIAAGPPIWAGVGGHSAHRIAHYADGFALAHHLEVRSGRATNAVNTLQGLV